MRCLGRPLVLLAPLLPAACGSADEPQTSADSAPPAETPAGAMKAQTPAFEALLDPATTARG